MKRCGYVKKSGTSKREALFASKVILDEIFAALLKSSVPFTLPVLMESIWQKTFGRGLALGTAVPFYPSQTNWKSEFLAPGNRKADT